MQVGALSALDIEKEVRSTTVETPVVLQEAARTVD